MAGIWCPKCHSIMREWSQSGVTLDHCGRCKGLWFDRGELTDHFANLGAESPEPELRDEQTTEFTCPRCPGIKLALARYGGIAVERCPRCEGLFLDLGELHELLGALQSRGRNGGRRASGFDNFALGLYLGMRIGGQ